MGDVARKLASMLLEEEPRQRMQKKRVQKEPAQQPKSSESPKDFIKRHDLTRKANPLKMISIDGVTIPVWARSAKLDLEQAKETEFDIIYADVTHVVFSDGLQRYSVYQNLDEARSKAISQVKNDLEEEPGNFNQDWLEKFINIDKLRRQLHYDVSNMNTDRWNEEDDVNAIDQLVRRGLLDADENFEEPRTPEIESKFQAAKETAAEQDTDNDLKDPISYLEDIYGRDASKEAIRIAGIDYGSAATDAIYTDGLGHFLAPYDSQQLDLPSGAVAFRTD